MTQSAREKISLFHLRRIVMWAICSVVSVMVVAMVNFILMMIFGLVGLLWFWVLFFKKFWRDSIFPKDCILASEWHWPDTQLYREL